MPPTPPTQNRGTLERPTRKRRRHPMGRTHRTPLHHPTRKLQHHITPGDGREKNPRPQKLTRPPAALGEAAARQPLHKDVCERVTLKTKRRAGGTAASRRCHRGGLWGKRGTAGGGMARGKLSRSAGQKNASTPDHHRYPSSNQSRTKADPLARNRDRAGASDVEPRPRTRRRRGRRGVCSARRRRGWSSWSRRRC